MLFDIGNFWNEENKELLALKVFRDLYDKDKSKDKIESSTLMNAIYLVYDYTSRYASQPLSTRLALVETEYLGEAGFFETYKEHTATLIETYLMLQKDSERRYLDTWQETVEKRRLFMKDTEYDSKTWRMLDEMLINSKQILAQKDEIMERIMKAGESKIKGNIQLSLLAQGKIVPLTEFKDVEAKPTKTTDSRTYLTSDNAGASDSTKKSNRRDNKKSI